MSYFPPAAFVSGDQSKVGRRRPVHRRLLTEEAIRKHFVFFPVHAFGLWRQTICHRSAAPKPDMELLSAAQSPVVWLLPLALICKLMTMTAIEDAATV